MVWVLRRGWRYFVVVVERGKGGMVEREEKEGGAGRGVGKEGRKKTRWNRIRERERWDLGGGGWLGLTYLQVL